MIDRRSERTTVSLRERKSPRRHIPRRAGPIDSFRPLTFVAAATDLDVEHVHVFPERGSIVLCFVTGRGTTTVVMPPRLAAEIADGLSWLVAKQKEPV